ncbi:MAG: ABC transporter permease subunit [Bdellovibrio sp.]|nr:ABC transporter permease subunit [Bdellovibrio sp.]
MNSIKQIFDLAGPKEKRGFNFHDFIVIAALILIIWIIGSLGRDMTVHFSKDDFPEISLNYWNIPYYAARSTLRMFIAYGASFFFTLIIGYTAVHSQRARTLILPILDVLQSVPVLGFLSVTVTGFMALFPGSALGIEMASLFAIFTGQVWNMTFGFYHSLVTVPSDMKEAGSVFKLNAWQKFKTYELPSSAISLVWNSMMSFGGGWFFVVQSEAITVLNQQIKLPGLGSYMALAIEKENRTAAVLATLTMVLIVIITDQLIWRPVVAWSQKFRMEQVESTQVMKSWFLEFLKKSEFIRNFFAKMNAAILHFFDTFFAFVLTKAEAKITKRPIRKKALDIFASVFFVFCLALIVYYSVVVVREIKTGLNLDQIQQIFGYGLLTMGRVFFMVVAATLIWTPIGVWIGFRPRVATFAQPLAQIAASFPVNMTFPFVVGFFVSYNVSMNWGSILLIALGTQWYILFNVIAGASSIPTDLKESAAIFNLKGFQLWKKLIIPAIFPYWVTGACTAAGGAWNASIVAELATWGDKKLVADGLGSFIARATDKGDWPAIFCSIGIMSIFVIVINKLLWRNLYGLAEKKFRLD